MQRQKVLTRLQGGAPFDLLVIGGGAAGCGLALDAATRGLDVALIELGDFAQGTSSKSTKLVHGGVRYLEKAVRHADKEQFKLVREGLRERGYLLRNAPHLAHPIRFLTPLHSWREAAYIFSGLTLYDLLAGKLGIGRSRFVSRTAVRSLFPNLRLDNAVGGAVYYDGQFNDARMAVALARTAAFHGAVCANYVEAVDLPREYGRLRGAVARDRLTGETWEIRARGVVNAAGPFIDAVRRMDDPGAPPMLKVSSGIHISLDAEHAPPDIGLMAPRTDDGRVLFMIPWQGYVIFGTTDESAEIEHDPVPTSDDVDYLLDHAARYLNRPLSRRDVRAAWCGLRPLLFAPGKNATQEMARNHAMTVSPSGLLTIAGGKWTSYRSMAEEGVDKAVEVFRLSGSRPCVTRDFKVLGSRGFVRGAHAELARAYSVEASLVEALYGMYGDETGEVLELGKRENLMDRIHPACPYIAAQVAFAVRREWACRLADVLVRRLPLGLLQVRHALEAAPAAAEIMERELRWDAAAKERELAEFQSFLQAWEVSGNDGEELPGGRFPG